MANVWQAHAETIARCGVAIMPLLAPVRTAPGPLAPVDERSGGL